MKSIFSFLLLISSLFAFSQTPKDTTHYFYDTTKTLAWYVVNLNTGEAATSYVLKVTKSRMDFVNPTPEELKSDSFVVKKKKVPLGAIYFVPVTIIDSAASKKTHKQMTKLILSQLPSDLILFDANKNFDYLIPKQKKDSTSKTPVNLKK